MSIKSFFSKEKSERSSSNDYKTDISKKSVVIIAVISLVIAVIIWAIAVSVDSTARTFTSVKIKLENAQALEDAGYTLILDTETVSFSVRGRTNEVNALTEDAVVPYIDLSGVSASDGRVTLEIKFNSKIRLMYSGLSVTEVTVQISDAVDENAGSGK